MRRIDVLIPCLVLVAGCTHCQVATFYKPSPEASGLLRTDPGLPTYVGFSLGGVPFTVAVCGGGHLAPPIDSAVLCTTVELDQDEKLRFVQPILIVKTPAETHNVKLIAATFEILCRTERGERTCSSSEEPPTQAPIEKGVSRGATDRYTFDPAFEFRGAKDTLHEGAWFGHRTVGKRRYIIRTAAVPTHRAGELGVELPQVEVNGRRFTPPALKFRTVTEDVCRVVTLQ